ERMARRLIALEVETPPPFDPPDDLTHYELLDIEPAASDEDIRRAYRRVREIYGQDSLVVCGLWNRERLYMLQAKHDEAYETLMDGERGGAYARGLSPDGQPPRRRPASDASGPLAIGRKRERTGPIVLEESPPAEDKKPLPPEPAIGADTEFTGDLLR